MKSPRRIFAAALFVCLTLLGMGAGVSSRALGANEGSSYAITIKDFGFSPGALEIPVGATVTWTNKDEEPHTATDTKGAFGSPALDTDDKFSFEFKTAGTFNYYCTVHPQMTGKIVVKAAGANGEGGKF
jgi:plastocyanin